MTLRDEICRTARGRRAWNSALVEFWRESVMWRHERSRGRQRQRHMVRGYRVAMKALTRESAQ